MGSLVCIFMYRVENDDDDGGEKKIIINGWKTFLSPLVVVGRGDVILLRLPSL